MTELLKKISTPTYIYALLIFVGYVNYFTFYIFFDINILNYLTFGELLLSFLNLTIPILILASFMLFLEITARIRFSAENEETIKRRNEYTYRDNLAVLKGSFQNIKSILKEKKWKSFWTYLSFLHVTFQFVFSILIYVFLFVYPFELIWHIMGKVFIYDTGIVLMFVLGFIWFTTFGDLLEKIYTNLEIRKAIFYSSLVLCFIGFITLINRLRAKTILDQKKATKIEFTFENEEIKSDSTLLFIGQTKDYLFLREVENRATVIYQKTKVMKLKISNK